MTVRSSAEPTLVSAPRATVWSLRLLLLAVAFGLVLMHHVAGAHQHSPSPPAPVSVPTHAAQVAAGPTASSATPDSTERTTGHAHGQAVAATQGAPVTAPHVVAAEVSVWATDAGGASLHVHLDPPSGPDMATVFHECLALLAAAAALALCYASRRVAPERPRHAGPVRSPGPARPHPVPLRLAQLQILRL